MKPEQIDRLLERLEKETKTAQADAQMAARLEALKETAKAYKGEDEVVSFADIAERVKTTEEAFKIMTGWENFDKIIQGFRPQQVVVVSALTKSGKTQWCMDL